MSRYNAVAHRLKLIPASSKRAAGVTYELRINREATTPAELANVDLKACVWVWVWVCARICAREGSYIYILLP